MEKNKDKRLGMQCVITEKELNKQRKTTAEERAEATEGAVPRIGVTKTRAYIHGCTMLQNWRNAEILESSKVRCRNQRCGI